MQATNPAHNVPLPGLQAVLALLAAPQATIAAFLLVAAAAIWVSQGGDPTRTLLLPLGVVALNLLAALIVSPRLRGDFLLLVFHLCLLALLLLVALTRLTHMEGQIALTRGALFDGRIDGLQQGPWHDNRWQRIRFINDGIIDEHPANGNEYRTFNRVRWWDRNGRIHAAEIGDDRPLLIDGYRIYAGPRGPAPLLLWEQTDGPIEYASLQLGVIHSDGWQQGKSWQLPGGPEIWVSLDHPFTRPEPGTVQVNLGTAEIRSPLVVRAGEMRHPLAPGESITLPGGQLSYVRLEAWLGYRISYEVLTPWMAAAVLLAVVSLATYFLRRLFLRRMSVGATR
jgi:cytochrome c biogenesis protein